MARRTLNAMALSIIDRVDRDRADTTLVTFVESMLIFTLQEINAVVPWARWLMDEANFTATTADVQYIVMPSDLDIDSLINIRNITTNRKIIRISPEEADMIDPGRDLEGDELVWWFQRVETVDGSTYENRIYFLYRPDSADTLTAIFGVTVPQPASGAASLLPEKYEPIWADGALSKVWERLDAENLNMINMYRKRFEQGLQLIVRDANASPAESSVLASHRPLKTSGVSGPSFPANFDITS